MRLIKLRAIIYESVFLFFYLLINLTYELSYYFMEILFYGDSKWYTILISLIYLGFLFAFVGRRSMCFLLKYNTSIVAKKLQVCFL